MRTIAIMRPEASLAEAVKRAEKKGFTVLAASMVALAPVECPGFEYFLKELSNGTSDYVIFTSVKGVMEAFRRQAELGKLLSRAVVVAIGPKTREALAARGVTVRHVPKTYSSEGLVELFSGLRLEKKSLYLIRSTGGSPDLVPALERLGARVHDLQVYSVTKPENVMAAEELLRRATEGAIDVYCFTDAMSVKHFFALASSLGLKEELLPQMRKATLAAIGLPTVQALEREGLDGIVTPRKGTFEALLEEVAREG